MYSFTDSLNYKLHTTFQLQLEDNAVAFNDCETDALVSDCFYWLFLSGWRRPKAHISCPRKSSKDVQEIKENVGMCSQAHEINSHPASKIYRWPWPNNQLNSELK